MRAAFTLIASTTLAVIVSIGTILVFDNYYKNSENNVLSFTAEPTPTPTPYDQYSIDSLSKASIAKNKILIKDLVEESDDSSIYSFEYIFDPSIGLYKQDKKVTGVINKPNDSEKHPIVIMIRGYVDKEIYYSGLGTSSAAKYFADNGFITIAPDFLGYAESDTESFNIFEARFQTYTTVLSLLESLQSIKEWDGENIFIWAHSNGGQIALNTLAITGESIPTTLWAPVTKPFPYSILYFMDELEDGGKYLRSELSKFEDLYDVNNYNFVNYLDKINSPVIIHQGMEDDAVPFEWNEQFANVLEDEEIESRLYLYPTADHNMKPDWNTAIKRDLDFFLDNIK